MATIRAPAVAGSFYPNDAHAQHTKETTQHTTQHNNAPPPKAIIAPHAGFIYSGPIAASVYAQVANGRDTITRVILRGPSQRVPFRGIATSCAEAYATPLGIVPIDADAMDSVAVLPQVQVLDRAHAFEHSLE